MNEKLSKDKKENFTNIKGLHFNNQILYEINKQSQKNLMNNNEFNSSYVNTNKQKETIQEVNIDRKEGNFYKNSSEFRTEEKQINFFDSENNEKNKKTIPSIFNNIITLNHNKIKASFLGNCNSKTIEQGIFYLLNVRNNESYKKIFI